MTQWTWLPYPNWQNGVLLCLNYRIAVGFGLFKPTPRQEWWASWSTCVILGYACYKLINIADEEIHPKVGPSPLPLSPPPANTSLQYFA